MKLIFDMNISPTLALLLSQKGVDAGHWFMIGKLSLDAQRVRVRLLPLNE